jgi:outer membrane protein assembly factor BamB
MRRVALISIVVVASIAGIGGSIHLVRDRGASAATSGPVTNLEQRWSVQTGAGPIGGLAIAGDRLYVTNRDGLLVYPHPCPVEETACTPAWRGAITDGPLSAPVVAGDRVYAGSASGKLYAFPATCQAAACLPLWVGDAGQGPVNTPAVNDDFVYATSDRLAAFPAACGSSDQSCPAAWTTPVPGGPGHGAPSIDGGLIFVSSASVVGGVYAYPAICATGCRPTWSGVTQGPASAVGAGGGAVYVVARGRLLSFPLACSQSCSPSWTGTFTVGRPLLPGSVAAPISDDGAVYVSSTSGTLWVFPASCVSSLCSPLRSFDLGAAPLREPRVLDGRVFVTAEDGTLFMVDDTCDRLALRCPEALQAQVAQIRAAPVVAGDLIYLGDEEGTLRAFAVPT